MIPAQSTFLWHCFTNNLNFVADYILIMFSRSGSRVLNLINTTCIQSRGKRDWVRKPLGSPMAKSKLFRIPQKPTLPEDEKAEIKRLYDNYKNQMKSLR